MSSPERAADPTVSEVEIQLVDGRRIRVARDALQPAEDGYFLALSQRDIEHALAAPTEEGRWVIPLLEEEIAIEKRMIDTARVRIRKRATERVETVATPLRKETVQIERVSVDAWADAHAGPRTEGDTIVIPVFEEVMVKRLILREEIRITRRVAPAGTEPREVVLRREEIEIERIPVDSPQLQPDRS